MLLAVEPGPHDTATLVRRVVNATSDLDKSDVNLLQRAVADARAALGPAGDLLSNNRGLKTYELLRDMERLVIDVDLAENAARDEDWTTFLSHHSGVLAQGLDDPLFEDRRREQRSAIVAAVRQLRGDLGDGAIQSVADQILSGRAVADLLPRQLPSEVAAKANHLLVFARDMHRSYELRGSRAIGTAAHASGLIARRTKTQRHLFFDVVDETGSIQVVVPATALCWDAALALRVRDAVRVQGQLDLLTPRHGARVLTLIANDLEQPTSVVPHAAAPPIYLARLANHFRAALTKAGYAEVETKLISSQWPSGGVEVLKVLYDGMGPGSFALAPSPAPQLIGHLIRLPVDRVFAVSRCITPTYRDPHVSTEASVVAAAASDVSLAEVLTFVHDVAVELQRSGSTAPLTNVAAQLALKELPWPPYRSAAGVQFPELQVFEPVEMPEATDRGAERLIARLCWPYAHEEPQFRDYVLAEGHSLVTRDEEGHAEPSLTVVTINIERLLTLLLNEHEGRRIPALAG